MPEDQVERELRERTIEIGEWFNPFVNYDDTPYDYDREKYRGKTIPFVLTPIGKLSIDVVWDRESEWKNQEGRVILPFSTETIKIEDLTKYEEKIESRLLQVGISCEEIKFRNQDFPYQVEVELPTGKVLFSPFHVEADELPLTGLSNWREGKEQTEAFILIPEVENILDKIQMRIVPVEKTNISYPQSGS